MDRIRYLCDLAAGRRVIHVGFADAGFKSLQCCGESWLHDHLAGTARELVGLDLDEAGVAAARASGYECHLVDCCDVAAVEELNLPPGDVVILGETIEHVERPGDLLEAARRLCTSDGWLAVTTPNACGWVNPMASVGGLEVNHPDHVVMFTWFTLTNLMRRHGWDPVGAATYVPAVKPISGRGGRARALAAAARMALWMQRFAARTVAPFAADGLIVVARPLARSEA